MQNLINSKGDLNISGSFLKSKHRIILLQILSDIITLSLSFSFLFYIRFESGIIESHIKPGFFEYSLGVILMLVFWMTVFFFTGMYKNWYERSPFDELASVIKVTLVGSALIVIAINLDSSNSPRLLFLYFIAIMTFNVFVGRFILRIIEKKLRENRKIFINAIIIGNSKRVIDFYHKTMKSPAWGYRIIGMILTDNDNNIAEDVRKMNIPLTELSNLEQMFNLLKPEEVIITSADLKHSELIGIATRCAENKVIVKIEPDLYDIFTGQTKTHILYGIPLIEIKTQLMKPWQELIKRLFDIVFSALVLIIGLPIWLLIGLIVRLESSGPVIYTQIRVGRNGKIFKMYKFRSMVKDANKTERQWTIVNDPRVTKFGRLIRKTHLDEVPQFFNVLIGDMSVVGPRPEQPKYVDEFSQALPYYKRRLLVRPGITGWWQVQYQPHVLGVEEIENRLKDDFYYIENMSIQLDIEIVVRTVWCVFKGHGQA